MNRSEQLRNDYEDALFALLMDRVVQEEGARLLEENERLQQDPDAAVPAELDRANRNAIRRAFARERRHVGRLRLKKVVLVVLAAILAAIAVLFVAYAAFPEVRLGTLNVLIKASNVASQLNLVDEYGNSRQGSAETQKLMGYTLPRVDEKEFSIADQGEDRLGAWIKYSNDNGENIYIRVTKSSTKYVDTEDAQAIEKVSIHGYDGEVIEQGNSIKVYWLDIDHNFYVEITGAGISREFIMLIADEIIFAE